MPASVRSDLDAVPRKMLAAGSVTEAKEDRKPVAENWQVLQGKAIERAIVIANLTKQEVAFLMGYGANQAPLSRWISGTENPQFSKLWKIEALREPLCMALSQMCGADAYLQVKFRRIA